MKNDEKAEWERGFTLIELVMVIIIIGILSVSALPRFFSLSTYQQWVYYTEVLNSICYARKLAVASGTHVQVTLTATSIGLQRRIEGATCTAGTTFQPITDPAFRGASYLKAAPSGVTLTASSNWPLYFDSLGQAIRASDCTVVNADLVTVGSRTITVIGATGFTQ